MAQGDRSNSSVPNPLNPADVIGFVLSGLGLFGGGGGDGGTSGFEPSDLFRRSQTRLGEAGADEEELMNLILGLARQAGQIGGEGLPSGLSLENLAGGVLPETTQRRIEERAFAGVNEGLRRASTRASERALARGLGPASSFEATASGELSRPLLEQAAGRQAQLEQQELDRLGGLRERTIANLLALQDLPALNKLMSLRLAEAQRDELSLGRFPGGLPGFVAENFGLPPIGRFGPGQSGNNKVDAEGRIIGKFNPNIETGGKGPTFSDPDTGREFDASGRRIG